MRFALLLLSLLTFAACTPADVEYCRNKVGQRSPEYNNCRDYFHQNQSAFDADQKQCFKSATSLYPDSLYDYGHFENTSYYDKNGKYHSRYSEYEVRDDKKNDELNRLRDDIMASCMYQRGWNNFKTWQAGRHP